MDKLTARQLWESEDFGTAHRRLVETGVHPLRAARTLLCFSMDELAKETGLSARTILRAEQGASMNPDSCRILAQYFHMQPWQLGLHIRAQN
jgi:DNA-binding XRE family transcriptional regulator